MLEARRIAKRFGPVVALDDVSVEFHDREVHAVLGENGAGKSTLMNILYGLIRPDAGQVVLDGRALRLRRPMDAHAAGIAMVHQHFMLVEDFTVAENLMLGHLDVGWWLPRSAVRRRAREAARRFALDVDPDRRVEELSVGQRQRVEILKALLREAHTFILDEPTGVLSPDDAQQLFESLRRLRKRGARILFISHKLNEVMAIADRVTVLRRGRRIITESADRATPESLAQQMVGRPLGEFVRPPAPSSGDAVLELRNVSSAGGHVALRDVSLVVRSGEIVGIAGVDGNGQTELARLVLGLDRPEAGDVRLFDPDGGRIEPAPRAVAHIADDRRREALVLNMSLAENAVLKHHADATFSRRGWLNRRAIASHAAQLVREFDIRPASPFVAAASLSGGNQQRLVIGRELAAGRGLVLAVNPTRGLDVASTDFVHRRLSERAANGCGVLLISADLDEILRLVDRIYVVHSGRLTESRRAGDPARPTHDTAEIARLMAGLPPDCGGRT